MCLSCKYDSEKIDYTYGRRAFSVAGPMVWNSLPEDMRDPECSVDSYRQSLETSVIFIVIY